MELKDRIESFVKLGKIINQFINNSLRTSDVILYNKLQSTIIKSTKNNPWFTEKNILQALKAISSNLTHKSLTQWLSKYSTPTTNTLQKKIGVIMAGNIPLVGFHDLICVLISGHALLIKPSSKDYSLIKIFRDLLIEINPVYKELIKIKKTLKNCDAYIATGSNNTARYFEYYFSKRPHIIRKNRNSIAILTGDESIDELQALANDILSYFGLGCRNVSKILIPRSYNFDILKDAFTLQADIIKHKKYANNYYYNKSIFLMNSSPFYDGGLFLLEENTGLSSPISVIYYEYYSANSSIKEYINTNKNKLQCIVSNNSIIPTSINFGEAQQPSLCDYADNIDTMDFLLNLQKTN